MKRFLNILLKIGQTIIILPALIKGIIDIWKKKAPDKNKGRALHPCFSKVRPTTRYTPDITLLWLMISLSSPELIHPAHLPDITFTIPGIVTR